MRNKTELLRRLRSGYHNADLVTVGGCTHDGRCLSAADEIERLRSELAWVRERMSGFCAGSWETGIADRVGRALDAQIEER